VVPSLCTYYTLGLWVPPSVPLPLELWVPPPAPTLGSVGPSVCTYSWKCGSLHLHLLLEVWVPPSALPWNCGSLRLHQLFNCGSLTLNLHLELWVPPSAPSLELRVLPSAPALKTLNLSHWTYPGNCGSLHVSLQEVPTEDPLH
jgi:hypothetical protein